jgi:para-nitrobenzyl esterase
VGALRFAAPAPAPTWHGSAREALAFGPVAPQLDRSAATARGEQQEDCLYLNVFTPRADAGRRPVMVWIHGGGFGYGSGSELMYDGGALAARGDVVIVTINYRLGALGYLYLGGHGLAELGAVGNAGALDQIAALAWVREHIAAYGGDPEQVTVFGESAGGVAVCVLLAMPAARGLFKRAIAQSGTANRMGGRDAASSNTQRFLIEVGCTSDDPATLLQSLRALSVEQILRAQRQHVVIPTSFWPLIDGESLPERPLSAVRAGKARDIPLLIGVNRDEVKLYAPPQRPALDDAALSGRVSELMPAGRRERAASVVETFRASRVQRGLPSDNWDIFDAIETASRFTVPAARMAEAQAEHQPRTYQYLFDWESPTQRLGACHALELSFVFGTLDIPGNKQFTGNGPDAVHLSRQMMDAWIAFARTSNPSCESVGEWPAYDARERTTMIFGKHTHVERAPFEEERALWSGLL